MLPSTTLTALVHIYIHITVTMEAFSRRCTWTQNNAHILVVLKCKLDPLFTQFLVGMAVEEESKAILHISLNFLHLIIQKKKKIENISYFTHWLKGGKKWFCSPIDWHAFYFTVKNEFNEKKWGSGILLKESYYEVSVKEDRK